MIDCLYPLYFKRRNQSSLFEKLIVQVAVPSSFFNPFRKIFQLYVQDGCLKTIQTAIYTLHLMVILLNSSMVCKHLCFSSKLIVICNNGSAISVCAQILTRVKTETSHISN